MSVRNERRARRRPWLSNVQFDRRRAQAGWSTALYAVTCACTSARRWTSAGRCARGVREHRLADLEQTPREPGARVARVDGVQRREVRDRGDEDLRMRAGLASSARSARAETLRGVDASRIASCPRPSGCTRRSHRSRSSRTVALLSRPPSAPARAARLTSTPLTAVVEPRGGGDARVAWRCELTLAVVPVAQLFAGAAR